MGRGVQAHYNSRHVGGEAGGVPTFLRGQQAGGSKAALGGLKNFVVGARHAGPAAMQRQRQIMHDAATHRDEVNGFGVRLAEDGFQIRWLFVVSYQLLVKEYRGKMLSNRC